MCASSAPQGELWAHVAPMPADPDDPYQLLRAVALLSRAREGRSVAALRRRTAGAS